MWQPKVKRKKPPKQLRPSLLSLATTALFPALVPLRLPLHHIGGLMGIQSKDCTLQLYGVCVDYTSIERKKSCLCRVYLQGVEKA